jgi:DNA-binding MltR family transcriptional regulator
MTKSKGPQVREFAEVNDRWNNLFTALNNDSDLICAIVATSYLNDILGATLDKFFITCSTKADLLKPDRGLLGSLRSKGDIAYCLGLIPKARCTAIRTAGEIRNEFAHTDVELEFDSDELRGKCDELRKWSEHGIRREVQHIGEGASADRLEQMLYGTPRRCFVTSMQTLCTWTMFDAIQLDARPPHLMDRPTPSDPPSEPSPPTE